MKLELDRFYSSDVQTRGYLRLVQHGETAFRCCTLELPWKDNENRVSCIPPGTYNLKHRPASASGTYDYDHFHVQQVPGRSWILIHAGNLYSHILGCVLVGDEFEDINGDGHPDVINSAATLRKLRGLVPPAATLEVRDLTHVSGLDEIEAETPAAEPNSVKATDKDLDVPETLGL